MELGTGIQQRHFMLLAFSLRLLTSLVLFSLMWVPRCYTHIKVCASIVYFFFFRCWCATCTVDVIGVLFNLNFFLAFLYSLRRNRSMQSGKLLILGRLWKKEGSPTLALLTAMKIYQFHQVHLVHTYVSNQNSALVFSNIWKMAIHCFSILSQ